ncbi:YDG domain-containing protein [Dyella mobilis]|uniref:YDG domain-containing protein n=1 Tax=Dyella mobilis TaxID=1849582 RepID=UPI0024E14D14|nr:YDG domain-containing protein [Dyella mobilis]
MNHIYRLCWNRSLSQWVPASELANATRVGGGSRKRGVVGQRALALSLLAVSLGMSGLVHAGNGPTGGQIVSGAGQIQQVGNVTTIRQDSSTLSLNWQSFDIGADQTVNFLQPGSNAIAVNRIFSSTPSDIYGHLNANGQVWLINPNGVLFGQGSQVNVGGLVASTLDVDDSTLGSSERSFSGSGKGSIVNRGTITAANGGYVALLGNQVSNQGTVTAQLGTVALAGGSAVTLTFSGSQIVHLQVDRSTLNNLAENRQLIVADGGRVIMTAGAKDALLASVVNNTGRVQAQTVQNHNGTITLLGGMTAGQVNVGGTLDASAPNGGSGGSIETSAAHFSVAGDAQVTAAAPQGKAGTWLVDPVDLTIDSTAATTISNSLNGGTSVTEQTTSTGATGAGTQSAGLGDINVNAAISWNNANATLELDAYHGINVNAQVSGTGKVVMDAAGANLTIASGASIVGGAGVTLATGANFVNNAGSAAVSTGTSSPWLIYSTNPTLDTAGGLTPNFIQYNAPYQTAAAASGNGFLYSVAPTLTVSGLTSTVTKSYDGTTSAPLAASNLTTSGLIDGDTIASATGTYASANAGSNIAVTTPSAASGFSIVNGAGIPVYGYGLSGSATANIGTINPAVLTATIIGDPSKVYDGTTTATLGSSNYQLTGFVAGQGATVNQPSSIAYAGADAGSQQLNATFTITNFAANSGTNLSNYVLPTAATGLGTITPAPVLLSGVLANNKVYDGGAADTLNLSNAGIYGVIAGDNVTLNSSGATGIFASANAGNNIAVSLSGFSLNGSKASDYQLIAPTNLTANITQKALSVSGVTANNKVYDSTTADTLNTTGATLNGVVAGDVVSLQAGSATGTFSQSDVGNSLAVTASGMSLSGAAAGNYTLTEPTGLVANITPRALSVVFNGSPTKIYDGTDAATLSQSDFVITGFAGNESATVSQSPAVYGGVNAGTNINVTATLQPSDFTVASGTKLSNYTFNSTVTGLGTIDPAPVVVSIVDNPTKVYDGNTTAALSGSNFTVSGVINGESITVNPATGQYASANAGIEGVSAALTSADFTAGSGTLLSNYALTVVANGYGTITQAPLAGSLIASLNKTISRLYDGTNTYELNVGGAQDFVLNGFKNGDTAVVNPNIIGYFASKNVANNQPFQVTLNSSDFTFTCGSGSACAGNYSYPSTIYTTGSITPAPLSISLVGNLNKVYDGSTFAQLNSSNFQINGFVSGEGATITPTASFNYASANAGSNIAINGTVTPSNYTPASGTLLSNYTLANTATGLGNIAQAPLYITGVYATGKVYDTNTSDTLSTGAAGLAGLVASDAGNVTLVTSTSGTFAQSNVGNGIAVTANGFSINGSAAANYSLQPISGLTANITPAQLTISGVTASDKVYDGTLADTLNTGSAALQGILSGDTVTLGTSGAAGTFSTANVGNNLAVSTGGFTLGGAQAGNYTLAQPGGLTANITPATLVATITGSPTKVYDGTNSATLTASDYTLTGFVNGQGASIPQSATANYVTPNAGTGLGVQSTLVVSDFVANSGTLLSNYILPTSATGNNGVITPYVLNLSGTRVYDTTTGANAALFGNGGVLAGLNSDTLTVSGAGTVSSKNVGTYTGASQFSLNTLALTGNGSALASNYTLIGGTDTLVITPATLTVSGTVAANKVYDGTTAASLSGSVLNGVLAGDSVTLGNDTAGTFATKNAGNGIAVGTNMSVSGTDAGNYILQQPAGISANITPLAITVTATGTNRQYDGTLNDAVTLAGTLAGDSVTINDTSATFGDANVGNGKTVTVDGISLSGASANNYTLNNTSTTTTANITPRVLNLTGTRIYDANTDANANLFGTSGVLTGVNGETLTLGGSGIVSSKNVGSYTGTSQFNLGTLSLTGNGSALASNYTLVGGTDKLTINKATLTVSGTVAADKVYDGTTAASLSGSVLNGVFSGDNVTLGNDAAGTFATKNVGNGIAVSTNMTVSGTDIGNYTLVQPTGIAANITPLAITVTATGTNRVYNGSVTDAVTLAGTLVGDNVTISDSSATFGDANVGNGKTVTVSGISLGGASASNYTLNNTSTTTTANITPVVLNLTGSRVYDATTGANASLFGNDGVLTGVNGETLTLGGVGTLSTANAGTHQAFAGGGLGGFTLTGNGTALASNYTLTGGTDWVTITPYVLNLSGTRVYDATTGAAGNLFGTAGVLNGINGDTLTLNGSGTVSSKNVGNYTGADFNLNTLSLTGNGSALAGNYTLVGGTDALTITKATLTVNGTAVGTKTYDGNTTAQLSGSQLQGVFSGDNVTLGNDSTGTFASPNAGSGIAVSTGMSVSGTDAGNYTLVQPAGLAGTITPYVLNLSGTRVYDATTGAANNLFGTAGVLNGINGDTLTLNGSGTVSSKNVGNYTGADFNLNTLSLIGNGSALAGNYTLVGGTDALTITKATLTVNGTAVGTKTYDGNTTAQLSGSQLQGVFSGDNVTLGNDSTGTFASPNAGTGIAVSTGMSVSGTDAGNYTLVQPVGLTGTITPYVLNLSGTRVYDATTGAANNLFGTAGVLNGINGDTLTLNGSGTVSSKNVGNYTGADFNLNTLSLTGNGSALAGNYTLVGGTDALTITKATLTVNGTAVGTKTYDGNTTAQLSGSQLQGVFSGDNVTLGNDSTGTFASPNAGTGIAVSTGMSVSGTDAGNYTLVQPVGLTGTITPYVLNLSGTRVYDATTGAANNLFGTAGVLNGINGDTLTLNGSGTVSSKNVGNYTGADFNLNTLSLIGNGSALAGNYTLVGGTDALTITKATLTVNGTAVGTKTYDGNTTAQLSGSQLQGVFSGDNVTLGNDSTGTFASPNAGTGIAVSTGMSVSGADAGNYTLVQPAGLAGTITPYVLNLSGTRVYDATTGADATLFGSSGVLNGINGDTLTLNGAGAVSSKNVGNYTGTDFNLNTLALTGNGSALAGNYTLVGGTDALTITKATLTVNGTAVGTKTYDGNTTAQLSGSQLQGVFSGDNVTLGNDSTGTFASPNAGTGIAVSTGMSVSGADAGNYTLVQPAGLAGTITPYVLNLSGTRVYDATTGADAALFGSSGVLNGINGDTLTLSGAGTVSSKNVGNYTGADFNLNTLALTGNGSALAGNYTLVGGTDAIVITPRVITVSATGQDKTYDTDSTAGVSLASNGVLQGDTVNFHDGAANFSSPNAGNNVSIAVSGITASGVDAGNYSFNSTATTSATINPYVLNLTGTRVYDGSTDANASLFGNDGVLAGLNGQTVTVSGSGVLGSKNVGAQGRFANLGSLVLGNGTGLGSNYTLAGGIDWVTITPATLTVIGTTTSNRVYDGTTNDALSGATLSGVFGGDNVVLGNATVGQFGDKNVGNGKSVATDMSISGGDAGNYILVQPTGLTADITPLAIEVTATGTNRMYNGKVGDVVALTVNGVLPGDAVTVTDGSANFADPYVGNGKTVTVSGITASGADAGNYLIVDPTTTATANITSAGFAGTGVQGSWIAQMQAGLQSTPIATPYGSADMDTVGVYSGNHQLRHRPIERNRARTDFRSGLALKLQGSGVRLPTDASP